MITVNKTKFICKMDQNYVHNKVWSRAGKSRVFISLLQVQILLDMFINLIIKQLVNCHVLIEVHLLIINEINNGLIILAKAMYIIVIKQ